MGQPWEKLKKSENYREFISNYLEEKNMRCADFARAAKCHRGFPKDVISGRRRLTASSFYSFEHAFKVPAAGKKLFRLLVVKEEPDVHPELSREKIAELISDQKSKNWSRDRKIMVANSKSKLERIMENPNVVSVFAATGDVSVGATFTEIQKRTKLPESLLHKTLDELIYNKLLIKKQHRFLANDLHIHFQSIGQNAVMAKLFRKFCDEAKGRSEEKWGSESELFLFSNICVNESRLPALKKALREVILGFADEAMQSDGDCVVKLTAAMYT